MDISATFDKYPELCSVFSFKKLQTYFDLINLLRPKLEMIKPFHQLGPPDSLSVSVHEFLKASFAMLDHMGKLAWQEFRLLAWNTPFSDEREEEAAVRRHLKLFMVHGLPREISAFIPFLINRVLTDVYRCL
jgi:hypothetical protein